MISRDRLAATLKLEWPGIGLFVLALGLRAWGLAAQPLWLDEVFSMQLTREGALAILRNSLSDPHPQLFYLLQWLGSGFGAAQSEWGWRWISVLSGALTIPAFYSLCRRFTGRLAAGLAGLVLAVSPFHVYYSQEGRAYAFTTLLVVCSSILVADLMADSRRRGRWIGLAVISLVGLYSSYFYLFILGTQGLALFIFARRHDWWLYAAILAVGTGLAAVMIVPTLSATARQHLDSETLTIRLALQSLAGEPVRYGVAWQQHWMEALIFGEVMFGAITSGRSITKTRQGAGFALLLILPSIILAALKAWAGIRLPYYETRQVLIFVPALLALTASGWDVLARRWSWMWAVGFCIPILVASGAGLLDYWQGTKSPEGTLAQQVKAELQAGEVVVSLDYWTTAGAYAYLPRSAVWVYSGEENGAYQFNDELRLYPLALKHPQPVSAIDMETLRNQPGMWVLSRAGINSEVLATLTQGCRQVKSVVSGQFEATRWEGCQP